MWDRVGPNIHALHKGPDPTGNGKFWGGEGAVPYISNKMYTYEHSFEFVSII